MRTHTRQCHAIDETTNENERWKMLHKSATDRSGTRNLLRMQQQQPSGEDTERVCVCVCVRAQNYVCVLVVSWLTENYVSANVFCIAKFSAIFLRERERDIVKRRVTQIN